MNAIRPALALLAACSPLLVGCSDFELDFRQATNPPRPSTVAVDRIALVEGVALAVDVFDGDDPIEEDDDVTFEPAEPILGSARTLAPERYVFFGVAAGATQVRVIVDGEEWGQIPAEVAAQP